MVETDIVILLEEIYTQYKKKFPTSCCYPGALQAFLNIVSGEDVIGI